MFFIDDTHLSQLVTFSSKHKGIIYSELPQGNMV